MDKTLARGDIMRPKRRSRGSNAAEVMRQETLDVVKTRRRFSWILAKALSLVTMRCADE